jgi:hypothetical protein
MGKLLFERRTAGSSQWVAIAALRPASGAGSLKNNRPGGDREIVLFYCEDAHSVVLQTVDGNDYEVDPLTRIVSAADVQELARLGPGESYEMDITTDLGVRATARWTHVG